jgi:hypothetical protein
MLASLLSAVTHAEADNCGKAAKRWVALRLTGPGFSPELASAVMIDLRTEVVRHGIDACPADTPGLPAPIATMEIEARAPTMIHLALDITDPATGKRSERELQLDAMPPDGHSLAVAVAADELLTSSWIKLASRPAAEPPPPTPSPRPVPATTSAAAAPPPETVSARNELGVLAAAERFGDGPWAEGLDLSLRRWLRPRWAAELTAGVRATVEETAPHGRIRSRAIPLSLRLLVGILPFCARTRAGAATVLTAMPIMFSADATTDATATSQTVLAVFLRGELWADVALGRFRLRVCAGVGAPLRSVTADDTGVAVGGMRGLALHGLAGLVMEM